jgi:hypothetical protein
MYERFTTGFVYALLTYAAQGLLFALAFVSAGVQRIDPEARGTAMPVEPCHVPVRQEASA